VGLGDTAMGCLWRAPGGHLETLQWARENHCPWNKDIVRARAAEGGHMDMLRWLDEQGGP